MAQLKDVVKVTKAQYDRLLNGETIGGHTYDANALYLVEDDGANIDLTGYATEAWVSEQIANISGGGSIDLTGYVVGSGLTADKIILGNGGSNVKTTNYGIVSSFNASSETSIPTCRALTNACTPAEPTLAWDTLVSIGTIAGQEYKIKLPSNPNTHYYAYLRAGNSTSATNNASTNGNTYLKLVENSSVRSYLKIKGTGGTTVVSDSSGNITIDSPSALSVDNLYITDTVNSSPSYTYWSLDGLQGGKSIYFPSSATSCTISAHTFKYYYTTTSTIKSVSITSFTLTKGSSVQKTYYDTTKSFTVYITYSWSSSTSEISLKVEYSNASQIDSGWLEGATASIWYSNFTHGQKGISIGRSACRSDNGIAIGRRVVAGENKIVIGDTTNDYYYAGGQSWTGSSDTRDKINIKPIKNSLQLINAIQPISFNYNRRKDYSENHSLIDYDIDAYQQGTKADRKITCGFKAQEVAEVLKELYGDELYANILEHKYEGEEDAYFMTNGELIPFLAGAIQEQQKIIENQQSQIDTILTKLEELLSK